jgi:hypothetical protein
LPLDDSTEPLETDLLGSLGAVLGSTLLPIGDADRIKRSTHDMIPDAGKILDSAPAHQHDGMLLKIMPNPWNIRSHFDPIRQANPRHFSQRRVGLLRGGRIDAKTDASLLRASLQCGALRLRLDEPTSLAHKLIDSRHECVSFLNNDGYFYQFPSEAVGL